MRRLILAIALLATPAFAGPNFDRAQAAENAWQDCVVNAATRMAGKASAETVAEAAFGRCTEQEQDFRVKLKSWSQPFGFGGGGYNAEDLERQMNTQRQRIRSLALAAALDG